MPLICQRMAGAREIADTTVSIPHPYGLDHALAWIGNQRRESVRGRATNFAIRLLSGSPLIGSASLRDIDHEHHQAELGFWIGREWWGQGYASEAAAAVIRFGFEDTGAQSDLRPSYGAKPRCRPSPGSRRHEARGAAP